MLCLGLSTICTTTRSAGISKFFTTAALGLLASSTALAADSDVHQLKKDTFNEFIKDNDLVLAECK